MPTEPIILIGTGGHAKVVLDALRAGDGAVSIRLVDEDPVRVGTRLWDETIGLLELPALGGKAFHVCIGANTARQRLIAAGLAAGGVPLSVVHPLSSQSRGARWGSGTFVAAGVRLGPDSVLGNGCIANHNSVIDHDCVVGDFCHIAPGATLAGGVRLGRGVLVGAGANLLPRVSVGDGAVIGAGAVVTGDVPPSCVYAGVPARKIDK